MTDPAGAGAPGRTAAGTVGPAGSGAGIVATATYLPERWMSAADLAAVSGVPEVVFTERFGLRGKHLAERGEHVTDLAVRAARALLAESGTDPASIDAVVYFGSTWKEYAVWQAAPRITHLLGCDRAFALELDYTSCGSVAALRVARSLIVSEPQIRTVLLVGASCESRLLDYGNKRSRFMFNFGDGAVAALLAGGHPVNRLLASSMVTDGSLSLHVKVPAGGSVSPASAGTVAAGGHYLDVDDLEGMRRRLGEVSLANFLRVAAAALDRSGLSMTDIAYVCPIHMKWSMHRALLDALGVPEDRAVHLADTGHLSGVDSLLGLDRLARAGRLHDGDVVLLLAAGTGYTWAASVISWGRQVY